MCTHYHAVNTILAAKVLQPQGSLRIPATCAKKKEKECSPPSLYLPGNTRERVKHYYQRIHRFFPFAKRNLKPLAAPAVNPPKRACRRLLLRTIELTALCTMSCVPLCWSKRCKESLLFNQVGGALNEYLQMKQQHRQIVKGSSLYATRCTCGRHASSSVQLKACVLNPMTTPCIPKSGQLGHISLHATTIPQVYQQPSATASPSTGGKSPGYAPACLDGRDPAMLQSFPVQCVSPSPCLQQCPHAHHLYMTVHKCSQTFPALIKPSI